MPCFTYICEDDHETLQVFRIKARRPKTLPCGECNKPSRRLFGKQQVTTMQGYWTNAADGVPTRIETAKQEREYEEKHGIAHLTNDDVKRMRDNTGRRKDRLHRAAFATLPDIKDSYEQAEAETNEWGRDYLMEQENLERFEMANAIEE